MIERGADLNRRDFPDNAAPLHFAAAHGDLETIRLLVEAGADIDGKGDDHGVGVLGWATCFGDVRQEVASYLLDHGAKLDLWTAIALDRADDLRAMVAARSLLAGRPDDPQPASLHAAAPCRQEEPAANRAASARTRRRPERPRCDRRNRVDDGVRGGRGPGHRCGPSGAGLTPDLLTLVNMARYGEAEAMLRDDPSRIGPDGGDTIALHVAVSKRNLATIRWLLAHGIDVNAKRRMWDLNHTALHMTIESGAIEIARLLLDAGADPNVRDDRDHATALGWAEFFGRDEMAELIRGKGGVR